LTLAGEKEMICRSGKRVAMKMRPSRLLSLALPLLLLAGCAFNGIDGAPGGPFRRAEPVDGGDGFSPVIFLLIFSFAVGITTFALAFSLFLKKRAPLERLFLVVLTFFLLPMLLSTIISYPGPAPRSPGDTFFVLLLLTRVISAALAISLIAFIQRRSCSSPSSSSTTSTPASA
jgi:hypothetical protein